MDIEIRVKNDIHSHDSLSLFRKLLDCRHPRWKEYCCKLVGAIEERDETIDKLSELVDYLQKG